MSQDRSNKYAQLHNGHSPSGRGEACASVLRFRTFEVIPSARQITSDQGEVELGSRAFDLLVVLLQARGYVVQKNVIIRAVWPSTTVDDSNLRFQMGALRKALGQHRDVIKTIPGRGYLLAEDDDHVPSQRTPCTGMSELSRRLTTDHASMQRFTTERIAELEHENSRLRVAIANLALGARFLKSLSA